MNIETNKQKQNYAYRKKTIYLIIKTNVTGVIKNRNILSHTNAKQHTVVNI